MEMPVILQCHQLYVMVTQRLMDATHGGPQKNKFKNKNKNPAIYNQHSTNIQNFGSNRLANQATIPFDP